MKSNILLLAIPILAALVLMGCNQNSPSNSTETASPNPSMSNAGMMTGTTNMPATNGMSNPNMPATSSMPNMMPATNSMPNMMPTTNSMSNMMPASTNQ
jgi:hypothetical protein